MSRHRLQNLYRQIGSEDRLFEITLRFYQAMGDDLMIGFFFTGKDLRQVARRQCDFFLHVIGEKQTYRGKLPVTAHLHLPPILPGHFDRRLKILTEILQNEGLTKKQIAIWKEFENAFRNVVVSPSSENSSRSKL